MTSDELVASEAALTTAGVEVHEGVATTGDCGESVPQLEDTAAASQVRFSYICYGPPTDQPTPPEGADVTGQPVVTSDDRGYWYNARVYFGNCVGSYGCDTLGAVRFNGQFLFYGTAVGAIRGTANADGPKLMTNAVVSFRKFRDDAVVNDRWADSAYYAGARGWGPLGHLGETSLITPLYKQYFHIKWMYAWKAQGYAALTIDGKWHWDIDSYRFYCTTPKGLGCGWQNDRK